MNTISKTFRILKQDYEKIENKLKTTNLNFTEFAKKSLLNQKIHTKEKIKYVNGYSIYKIGTITFMATLIFFLILINTILPVRFISSSPWIIKQNNRFIDEEHKKFFIINKKDIIYDKNIAYIYLDK